METPFITHLTSADYEHIYEPAEDSFLMIDALESELNFIKELKPAICVEIGSGSGITITAISNVLKSNCYFMATDVNTFATKATKKTSNINHTNVDVLQMDLITSFVTNSIDILIFNPPYVPTTSNSDSKLSSNINQNFDEINFSSNFDENLIKSWAGGRMGREVMDRVLVNLNKILTVNGVLYLLVIKENNLDDIIMKLKQLNYKTEIILERKIRCEHLFILKIMKNVLK